MRYLLLSVLVACIIGVMIPSVFAQTPAQVLQQMEKLERLEQQAYVQQQLDRQYQQKAQAEEFFKFVKYAADCVSSVKRAPSDSIVIIFSI